MHASSSLVTDTRGAAAGGGEEQAFSKAFPVSPLLRRFFSNPLKRYCDYFVFLVYFCFQVKGEINPFSSGLATFQAAHTACLCIYFAALCIFSYYTLIICRNLGFSKEGFVRSFSPQTLVFFFALFPVFHTVVLDCADFCSPRGCEWPRSCVQNSSSLPLRPSLFSLPAVNPPSSPSLAFFSTSLLQQMHFCRAHAFFYSSLGLLSPIIGSLGSASYCTEQWFSVQSWVILSNLLGMELELWGQELETWDSAVKWRSGLRSKALSVNHT